MFETIDPEALRSLIQPLDGRPEDLHPVVDKCKAARYVLIGEASHGTHEFYRIRAQITKLLIQRHGFGAIAIEGDWPDAHRVHRYVCGDGRDGTAGEALTGFDRFPTWMWRNADVLDFIGWLRTHNDELPRDEKVGFFGLDLYSMYRSMQAVIDYLQEADPAAAVAAKLRYECFDRFGEDVERYARAVGSGLSRSCRSEALAQLLEMQRRAFATASETLDSKREKQFVAEQNARVVASAEEYYRTMVDAEISSWNLRDTFMYSSLEHLMDYLERGLSTPAKVVVWAHNSHVGDARATTLGAGRELNIGQLVRQAHLRESRLIGFTTSEGTVTAASQWHAEAERKTVRPPIAGSWEALFRVLGVPNFYLDLEKASAAQPALLGPLMERAIGVIYQPQTELYSHYLHARIGDQFDALFHFDKTRAVEPLERTARWERGEVPETYPSAI